MKTRLYTLFVILFVTLVVASSTQAQVTATSPQLQVESLSSLPESDIVVYINASRIVNDALPRLLPEKQLNEFRSALKSVKDSANIDLKNLEFVAVTMRFNKPSEGTLFPIPDAMVMVRGDFDAKLLVGMATMMSAGKFREEKVGEHTLYLYSLSDLSKDASKSPFGAVFSEIALANLDASTIAVGNTSYIKAALEAAAGRGRIKAETVSSILRDSNTLISATGSPLVAFAKSFGLRMAANPDPNCMTRFGEYYISLTMTADAFKINGALNADNPETAKMVKNMLSGLFEQGKGFVPDKDAKKLIDQVKIFAEGDEVMAEATIPQQMAADMIRDMLAPKPPAKATATETKTVTKPRTRSGKSRRRT